MGFEWFGKKRREAAAQDDANYQGTASEHIDTISSWIADVTLSAKQAEIEFEKLGGTMVVMSLTVEKDGAMLITNDAVWRKKDRFWWAVPEDGRGGYTDDQIGRMVFGQDWYIG